MKLFEKGSRESVRKGRFFVVVGLRSGGALNGVRRRYNGETVAENDGIAGVLGAYAPGRRGPTFNAKWETPERAKGSIGNILRTHYLKVYLPILI